MYRWTGAQETPEPIGRAKPGGEQTAFRLDGVLQPEPGRDDLPLIFVETQSLSREEIRIMLQLPETDLKKTRFYQEVFREGLIEGREEGREEGRLQGEQRLVLRLLERRLGTLDAADQARVQALSADSLGALAEALLDFQTSADLDAWLGAHVA